MGDYVDEHGEGQNFTPDQLEHVADRREAEWRDKWLARLPLRIPAEACDTYVAERLILAIRARLGFAKTTLLFLDLFGDPAREGMQPRDRASHERFCNAVLLARELGYVHGVALPFGWQMCPVLHFTQHGIDYSREIAVWETVYDDEAEYDRGPSVPGTAALAGGEGAS